MCRSATGDVWAFGNGENMIEHTFEQSADSPIHKTAHVMAEHQGWKRSVDIYKGTGHGLSHLQFAASSR